MKIIETKVYKFEELTEDAQEKAIDTLIDINVEYEWWDTVYMDAENIGLKLTGFDIDRGNYCDGEWMKDAVYTANKILDDHGEHCETYKDAEVFLSENIKIIRNSKKDEDGFMFLDDEQELDELDDEFLKTLLEDYRIMLQKEYEYLTSEEAIRETIICNEYDFTEDGKLF